MMPFVNVSHFRETKRRVSMSRFKGFFQSQSQVPSQCTHREAQRCPTGTSRGKFGETKKTCDSI